MSEENGIIHACTIDGKGGGKELSGDDIGKEIKSADLAWVHLDANNPEARGWLEREVSYLDQIVLDALLAEETRPRMLECGNGVLLILRGVNLNEGADPEDMVSIRLWVDAQRIISIRKRKLKAVQDIRQRISEGKGPKNAGDFISMLSMRLFERMEPILTDLDGRTDDVEERILENPDISERGEIVDIRRKAIIIRRYIMPQRDAIAQLRMSDISLLETTHKRLLQEALNQVIRYIEDLDTIRERAQIVKDELTTALSDKLNKNMYMLSVIAAIFLPLGFLTGLLGINVGGIPGAENPYAFTIFGGMLVFIVFMQIMIFKKLRWF